MNYCKAYSWIIENARKQNRLKNNNIYYENHHIIPKCINGDNSKNNQILLTPREHFLAHWLLIKIYPQEKKLIYAFNAFCQVGGNNKRPISRLYKYAKEKFIKQLKEDGKLWKDNKKRITNSIWMKHLQNKKCIRVHKKLINHFLKLGYVDGRIIEHRISPTEETKRKISKANKGYVVLSEPRKKISLANKNRVWVIKDNIDKMVKKNEVKEYIKKGWLLGRDTSTLTSTKNYKWIHNDNERKLIPIKEIQNYLNSGWRLGSNSKHVISDKNKIAILKRTKNSIWINNGKKHKRISKEQLIYFQNNNWKLGRIKNGKLGNNQFIKKGV